MTASLFGELRLTVPKEHQGWMGAFLSLAARKLRYSDNRLVVEGATRLAERLGTDLTTLLTFISDAGKATEQRFFPLLTSANKSSTQSAQPLTASDAGASATISVSAHSVQYGFGSVAYNSGSVSGLAYSTTFYVYADDPNYAGGAVTYLATTNPLTVTASNGRYYLGKVTTPAAAGPPASGGWGGGGGGGGSQIP